MGVLLGRTSAALIPDTHLVGGKSQSLQAQHFMSFEQGFLLKEAGNVNQEGGFGPE